MLPSSSSRRPAILLVEDDADVAALLETVLRQAGYLVQVAHDGRAGYELACTTAFSCFVLDRNLPGMDGLTLTRELRGRGCVTPILMLTVRDAIADRVGGLEAGADDYLPKPFDPAELLARVAALVRRHTAQRQALVLRLEDLTIDLLSRRVARGGRVVELTPREYALLECLARRAGTAVSRQTIAEEAWATPFDEMRGTNLIDVYVNYVRKKLDDATGTLVRTVRGVGYMLATPATAPAERETPPITAG